MAGWVLTELSMSRRYCGYKKLHFLQKCQLLKKL